MRIRFAVVGCANSDSIEHAGSLGGGERVAVVLLPQLEDRVGRRIVLAARALRDLLARLRDDERRASGPSISR